MIQFAACFACAPPSVATTASKYAAIPFDAVSVCAS